MEHMIWNGQLCTSGGCGVETKVFAPHTQVARTWTSTQGAEQGNQLQPPSTMERTLQASMVGTGSVSETQTPSAGGMTGDREA